MAEIQENRAVPRIDCYSCSMADVNVECGLVIDISETGAGLTIPEVDPGHPAGRYGCLHLNVFHPDYSSENRLDIRASIAWIDDEYSKDRLKLGVHFSEMDDDKSSYVVRFIDWLKKKDNYFLRCELEKC